MTKAQVEVMSVQRRRRWSWAEKERIVAAKPGAIASEVARAAAIYTSQLFRRRQQLCKRAPTPTTFNAVVIAPEPASASPALREQAGVIEIEFAFGGRMRITGPVATSTVKALIAVLARSSLMCRHWPDWVGAAAATLMPLVEMIRAHVLRLSGSMPTTRSYRCWPRARPALAACGPMCATIGRLPGATRRRPRSVQLEPRLQFSRIPDEISPVDPVTHSIPLCPERGSGAVVKLGEVVIILDLHRQGLTVSAIARELGIDRKTSSLWSSQAACAVSARTDDGLSGPGRRLWRELRERGYRGGYTAVTDQLRQLRPAEHTRSKAPINAPIHQFRHSGTAPAVIILP